MAVPKPYHHGNLKQALVRAALELIAENGPRGFTLREAARRAGVSHNAPYRHFRDKQDLLAAVSTDGFDRLTRSLAAAGPKAAPHDRLRLSCIAYVDFALHWPQHFAAMFDVPWDRKDYPECAVAAERCFEVLLGFVRACQAARELPAGNPLPLACQAWSLVHGVAKLANAGQLPWRSRAQVLRFCEEAINAWLHPVN